VLNGELGVSQLDKFLLTG